MTEIEIPSQLPTILRNFTLQVLRNKPHDIVDYAVEYFTQLQRGQKSEIMIDDNKITTTVPSSSFSCSNHHEQEQQTTTKHNVLATG